MSQTNSNLNVSVIESSLVVAPSPLWAKSKVVDLTPTNINEFDLNEKQLLLARIRYNRLIDFFTGCDCFSLQRNDQITDTNTNKIENIEIYFGTRARDGQFIIPVKSFDRQEKILVRKISQDFTAYEAEFPTLHCIPIAAQWMEEHTLALFSFSRRYDGFWLSEEKHYQLMSPTELLPEALSSNYQVRPLLSFNNITQP
ncbi:MAG: hypothetical protein NT075_33060 [Chloroflexi bacterium]|nr:hypothetical protein [Chloroflexota bacterium]